MRTDYAALDESTNERISRGITWLDTVIPDWRHLIDTGTLNLASPASCVLGQVFAKDADNLNYTTGYEYANAILPTRDSDSTGAAALIEHGFDQPLRDCRYDYEGLTKAWLRRING